MIIGARAESLGMTAEAGDAWFGFQILYWGSRVSTVNGTSEDVLFLLLCAAARYGDGEAGMQHDVLGSDCSCSTGYSRTRVSAFRAFFLTPRCL
jgi:hypothetical protein